MMTMEIASSLDMCETEFRSVGDFGSDLAWFALLIVVVSGGYDP